MNIGILEAGEPPPPLAPVHGTYDAMVRRLLGASHSYSAFRAFDGQLPNAPDRLDGLVITGSAAGVKDGLPWVDRLMDFLRSTLGQTRLVGICFGHQVMAQAFGGEVAKGPRGWGMGMHAYKVMEQAAWMDGIGEVKAIASHQDQVVVQPPASRVHVASVFTPFAALSYDSHPSISFQFHPEFSAAYAGALFAMRRHPHLSDQQREQAIASLEGANDGQRVGGWINAFLGRPSILLG